MRFEIDLKERRGLRYMNREQKRHGDSMCIDSVANIYVLH